MAPTPRSAKTSRVLITGTYASSLIYSIFQKENLHLSKNLPAAAPTLFSWHPESFSIQLFAVREIPPNSELPSHTATPSPPLPNERRLLRPLEYPPASAPAPRFPALILPAPKSGSKLHSKFANSPIVLISPSEKPPPGTPKEAWAHIRKSHFA
ncbi:hypothetical protein BDP27DRAFT_1429594 [Rhodocollybia butyracea]|uniref:Uncharacterized protein n=1 Tax=Rhodocollybia butyracea TaxID=206335 RepID=A0A9P5PCU3_9AGAR|nr:hypothetical protein BDP27DRAFT_1429594 [Rhodocollybia butyracea]